MEPQPSTFWLCHGTAQNVNGPNDPLSQAASAHVVNLRNSSPFSSSLLVVLFWEILGTPMGFFTVFTLKYTLWLFNIAMENGPFIVDLPIKNSDFP